MNKLIIVLVAVATLTLIGCTAKQDTQSATAAPSAQVQPSPAHSGPGQAGPAANPHANMNPQEMTASADHRGKVVSTMNASGYTYIEVEEKGKKLWVAVMQIEVKVGDEVVFPDSPPVENFHSKTLNRTFDRIILAPAIEVNGKPGEMGSHPKTS